MTFEEFASDVRTKDALYRVDMRSRLDAAQALWTRYALSMRGLDMAPLSGDDIADWRRDVDAMPAPTVQQMRLAYVARELEGLA